MQHRSFCPACNQGHPLDPGEPTVCAHPGTARPPSPVVTVTRPRGWTGPTSAPSRREPPAVPAEVSVLRESFGACLQGVSDGLITERHATDPGQGSAMVLEAVAACAADLRRFVEDHLPRANRMVTADAARDLERMVNADA